MFSWQGPIFPQIAIAIGVLTSNRGEGDEPLWRIGRGTRVRLHSGRGAIAGCHCSVLWLRGRVTTKWTWCHCWVPLQGAIVVYYGGGREGFGGVDVVPLLGAIAGCHCSALWWGKGGLWGSGRGAIAGCHCRVPISVSYLPPKFRVTNLTQTPKKTTMNFVWSFLQPLHCSLH